MIEYLQYLCLFFLIVFYLISMSIKVNVSNPSYVEDYNKGNRNQLFWFIALLVGTQLILTYTYIAVNLQCYKVGLFLFPFFVWFLFIFGVYFTLQNSPGFINAFADVVGYYYVYSKINKLMSALTTQCTDSTDSALLKEISGDSALLFNSLTVNNFEAIWKELNLKPECDNMYKQELLNYVIIKNKIGEMCWYIWTSIVAVSVVSYYISTVVCEPSMQQVMQNQQDYQAQLEEQESIPQPVYTAEAGPDTY